MIVQSRGKGNKPQNHYRPGYRVRAPGVFRVAIIAAILHFLLAPAFSQVSSFPAADPIPQGVPSVTRPDIGFATPQKLQDHYRKHGREFGEDNRGGIPSAGPGPPGPVCRRGCSRSGPQRRGRHPFRQKERGLPSFNPDGTIRTFFKPNDGEKYFRRQARRNSKHNS